MTVKTNILPLSRTQVGDVLGTSPKVALVASSKAYFMNMQPQGSSRTMSADALLIAALHDAEQAAEDGLRDVAARIQANNQEKAKIREVNALIQQYQTNPGDGNLKQQIKDKIASFNDSQWNKLGELLDGPLNTGDNDSKNRYFKALESEVQKLEGNANDLGSELSFQLTLAQHELDRATKVKTDTEKARHTNAMEIIRNIKS